MNLPRAKKGDAFHSLVYFFKWEKEGLAITFNLCIELKILHFLQDIFILFTPYFHL